MADDVEAIRTSSLIVIFIVGVVLVCVVGLGLVIILCIATPSTHTPGHPTSSQAPQFLAVNWVQQAAIELTSISRIMLFGETSMKDQRWQGCPGLRPHNGFLHINWSLQASQYTPPECFSEPPLRPSYKPWESTSTGSFVLEDWFLDDVRQIMDLLVVDLQYIADHGPLPSRFTNGKSTQFRWSTDAVYFLPPHDTLPKSIVSLKGNQPKHRSFLTNVRLELKKPV